MAAHDGGALVRWWLRVLLEASQLHAQKMWPMKMKLSGFSNKKGLKSWISQDKSLV